MANSAWNFVDHILYKNLQQHRLQNKKFLIAVSGGMDSMALLASAVSVLKAQSLGVFYFHHGPGELKRFRDDARELIQKVCEENGVLFWCKESSIELKGEAQFRKARLAAIKEVYLQERFDGVMWGHHRQDLLETRLIRMIRGLGQDGLQAMSVWKQPHFRPFLSISRQDLQKTLFQKKWPWIEDPSNKDLKYLRNWIRHKWLRDLEKKRPGALESFERSFENLLKTYETPQDPKIFDQQGFSRAFYLTLSDFEQKRLLAQLLFHNEVKNFRTSHLKEMQKRLDTPQRELTFTVLGLKLEINAEQVKVSIRPDEG